MNENKGILEKANDAIRKGDTEGFLAHCTDDTQWTFVGEQTLTGKEAVRKWMSENYLEPPRFTIEKLLAEGDFVTALGKISLKDENGAMIEHEYCDVWQFRAGKMAELKAFVIKTKNS